MSRGMNKMPTIYRGHGRTTTKPTLPMRIAAFINGFLLVTELFLLTSKSITLKCDDTVHATKTNVSVPIRVCNRVAPLPPDDDVQATQKYASCPLLSNPPENTTILMLDNAPLFGRPGNNLIEFFHS
jgi:hypothetical protein